MNIFPLMCNLLVCVFSAGPKTDYCFLDCLNSPHRVHIVCKRLHKCPQPKVCKEYAAFKRWRETMLDIFNDARNAIANGTQKGNFGNPGAKRMNALSYDMELEYIITCYENQCEEPKLEGCYQTVRFTPYAVGCSIFPFFSWRDIWVSAVDCGNEMINDDAITYEGVKSAGYNHVFVTKYAWNAKYLGCAVNSKDRLAAIVCLLGPGIDKHGDLVYKFARHPNEIASECEGGTNKRYSSLCGEIAEVPSEIMWSRLNVTFTSGNIFCVHNLCKIILIYMIICSLFRI